MKLETIEVAPKVTPQASVIWLHGLGASSHDFLGVPDYLGLPDEHPVKFIFPQAPTRAITINGGMMMPGWYDIYAMDLRDEDQQGIVESAENVSELITKEQSLGIANENIILAGFSQGGAIAMYVGLRYPEVLGGIMALSTYLVLKNSIKSEFNSLQSTTPVFIAHGMFDPVVPYALGQNSAQFLQETLGMAAVNFNSYQIQHTVSPEELTDIGNFIKGSLTCLQC